LTRPIREQVDTLLLREAYSDNRRLTGMCDELTKHGEKHGEWLWTFLQIDGVQATNNASEPCVTWSSGGNYRSAPKARAAAASWSRS
jgi:hypothetical protein